MTDLVVNVKKLVPEAVIPTYQKEGDAGLDLTCTSAFYRNDKITYGTGLSIEIPDGYVGLLFPRSSVSKFNLDLTNSVGVIDSGYRGEIKIVFRLTKDTLSHGIYLVGDRIAQLVILPYPKIILKETEELSDTDRGTEGFGSTGK